MMKKLFDGTKVSDGTPTKMVDGERHLFTEEEMAQYNSQRKQFKKQIEDLEKTKYRRMRAEDYDPVGDQLDAIWKFINQYRLSGGDLPQDTDDMLGRVLAVKRKYPPPEKGK